MIDISITETIETSFKQPDRRFYSLGAMTTMGERIRGRLEELDKSQQWLADQAGIKQPSIFALMKKPDSGSKHIVKIARALGVAPQWLTEGVGPKTTEKAPEALLVGKVGAGAEITRFDDGVVLAGVEPPPGVGPCNAAEVVGDSMYPMLLEGWLIFYGREHDGIPEECVGKLAVVQIKDGPTLVKFLKRGSRKGLWRLEGWNTPPREDVRVAWAAKVLDIRPR